MRQADAHRRRGEGRSAACAAALLACIPGLAPAQEGLDALEARTEAVSERLSLLVELLEGTPDDARCADLCETPLLAPGPPLEATERLAREDLRVLEVERAAEGEAGPALAALRRSLPRWLALSDRSLELKIIDLQDLGQELHTTVVVHGSGRRDGRVHQVNAEWALRWSSDEGGPLRVSRLEITAEQWVVTEEPWFVEATGGVLDPGSGHTGLIAWGCDAWVGRTDHVGAPHWFGHNGIALGDVNGDGLEDLYVATGTGTPNLLLVQRPDGTLEDRGDEAGVAWLDDTKGVLLLDFDGDGDKDLLCAIGPALVLSANDGEGSFTPVRSLQAETTSAFYSLAAADYDLDGDLDVYALRYVQSAYGQSIPRPFQDARNGPRNHLLRNDGSAGFTDVTDEVGLGQNNDRFSLAAGWADVEGDGDPDLYVANDFGRNNLYRNDGGRFVDVAEELGVEDQAAGMGVTWADVDRDGDLDLHVSNMFSSAGLRVAYQPQFRQGGQEADRLGAQRHAQGNSLFLNEGSTFREVGGQAGIRMGRWSWGGRFVDLDGDGYEDLVVPNGFMTNEREDDL